MSLEKLSNAASIATDVKALWDSINDGSPCVVEFDNKSGAQITMVKQSTQGHGKFVSAPDPIVPNEEASIFSSSKADWSMYGNLNFVIYQIPYASVEVFIGWDSPYIESFVYHIGLGGLSNGRYVYSQVYSESQLLAMIDKYGNAEVQDLSMFGYQLIGASGTDPLKVQLIKK